MTSIQSVRLTVLLVAMLFSGITAAQFVWLDEKGTKQFSDMPPPPATPANRILKSPKNTVRNDSPATPATGSTTSTESGQAVDPAAPNAPMNTAERNADFIRRKAEQDEKNKKAAEQTKLAAEKAKNCERAREYQRALDSGIRIASTDKNGERSFMSDESRARESQETNRVLNECR